MSAQVKKAAIIGAGQIGRGWAAVFARAGYQVWLYDADEAALERGVHVARSMVEDLAAAGLISNAAQAAGRITPSNELPATIAEADWVQECCPEDVDIKRGVFASIDGLAEPGALLGSSCSGIPGSRFLSDLPGRDRAIILHPANPVHAMPVVEIVPCDWHTEPFIASCRDALAALGQIPVVVRQEVPGFVMNRLQAAVINEAMSLVARGVIAPDDLDRVMEASIGLRWAFLGPFETMDLNAAGGFAEYTHKFASLYSTLGTDLRTADAWTADALSEVGSVQRARLPIEKIGDRQAWRDRTLLRLRRLLEDQRKEDPVAP